MTDPSLTTTTDNGSGPSSDPRRGGGGRTPLLIALAVAAVIGVVLIWFLSRSSPDEVDIDNATAQLGDSSNDATDDAGAEETAEDDAGAEETAEEDAAAEQEAADESDQAEPVEEADTTAGIEGTWTVDTGIGEFAFEDSTGTFVGFRVDEELSSAGAITAVGRTPEVSGTLTIEGTTVTETTVDADLNELTTDDSRRDGKTRSALGTAEFPTATFVLTEPIELSEQAASGERSEVTATGEMTIKGVTNPVTVDLAVELVDDVIVVVGSTDVLFEDYGVTPPSAPIVLSIDDEGIIEFQLFFTRR